MVEALKPQTVERCDQMPQIPLELTYSWDGGSLELSVDWWNKWKDHGYSWYLPEKITIPWTSGRKIWALVELKAIPAYLGIDLKIPDGFTAHHRAVGWDLSISGKKLTVRFRPNTKSGIKSKAGNAKLEWWDKEILEVNGLPLQFHAVASICGELPTKPDDTKDYSLRTPSAGLPSLGKKR
jgi:hypothetical protein